jgi:CRISPR-associated protein Csx3
MVNELPAVIIGGPPQAGKSVLFHSITHALRERNIRHHAIRACPDGEGTWSQESDQTIVSQIRVKGAWSDAFVQRICQNLEHRCLPFLIDMGGHPKTSQGCMFRLCTHSVLLLRADRPDYTRLWRQFGEEYELRQLAEITSELAGNSTLTAQAPIIEGTISGLVRDSQPMAQGPVFDALVECIATLFNSAVPQDLERVFFEQSPGQLLDLYAALHTITAATNRWEPAMLPQFLANLLADTVLAIYGAAPAWVYAALAATNTSPALYQFDPRLPFGWIQPLAVCLSEEPCAEVEVKPSTYQDGTVLAIHIPSKHLDYFQPEPLPFPPVNTDGGLILDGIMPFWLLTALVRLYKQAGVAWIAPYYPPINKAVVAYSRISAYQPGDLMTMPVYQ